MDKKKTVILSILTFIGFCLAVELCYIFAKVNLNLSNNPSFCSVSEFVDCDGVAKTTYAAFFGVPLALWGLIFYCLIGFLLFMPFINKKFPNTFFAVFKNPYSYIATLGFLTFFLSVTLAGLSIFEIHKICIVCFITYFLNLLIGFVAKTKGSFFLVDIKNTVKDFWGGVKKYPVLFILVVILVSSALYYTSTSYILTPGFKQTAEDKKREASFEEFKKLDKNIYKISGNTLGNPDAKVKIFVFSDFLCPFCRLNNIMVHKLAKENKNIQIIHMNYPLDSACNASVKDTVHAGSCILSRYAIAAKKQGKYWDMVSLIYDNMPKNEKELVEFAASEGIDTEVLLKDLKSEETSKELEAQIQFANKSNITGTPSFIIDDITYVGGMPYYEMTEHVKMALKRNGK